MLLKVMYIRRKKGPQFVTTGLDYLRHPE